MNGAKETSFPVGRFMLRICLEARPLGLGLVLYDMRTMTPQAWLYLSRGPRNG